MSNKEYANQEEFFKELYRKGLEITVKAEALPKDITNWMKFNEYIRNNSSKLTINLMNGTDFYKEFAPALIENEGLEENLGIIMGNTFKNTLEHRENPKNEYIVFLTEELNKMGINIISFDNGEELSLSNGGNFRKIINYIAEGKIKVIIRDNELCQKSINEIKNEDEREMVSVLFNNRKEEIEKVKEELQNKDSTIEEKEKNEEDILDVAALLSSQLPYNSLNEFLPEQKQTEQEIVKQNEIEQKMEKELEIKRKETEQEAEEKAIKQKEAELEEEKQNLRVKMAKIKEEVEYLCRTPEEKNKNMERIIELHKKFNELRAEYEKLDGKEILQNDDIKNNVDDGEITLTNNPYNY